MSRKIDILRGEITSDPLGVGYASMSDAEVAASLGSLSRKKINPVGSAELLAWSVFGGRLASIKSGIDGGADNIEKSLCEAAYLMIRRDGTSLDLRLEDRVIMLNALVSFGRITQEDADELWEVAWEDITRSQELEISEVTEAHVTNARQGI